MCTNVCIIYAHTGAGVIRVVEAVCIWSKNLIIFVSHIQPLGTQAAVGTQKTMYFFEETKLFARAEGYWRKLPERYVRHDWRILCFKDTLSVL